MALVLTSAPLIEPVTFSEEAKAHLRIDGCAEDVLISSLILTARLHVEAVLDVALVDQSWTLQIDKWPRRCEVEIPIAPLKAVTIVRVRDAPASWVTIAPTAYLTDIASRPPRIVFNATPRPHPGVPAAGIEIGFTAGFGSAAADVPAPLRRAVLMLVAHWYEHREAAEAGTPAARIPDIIGDLIAPFRRIRL